jgi:PHD/YefM family antitoxin component YafN of YafNO toxin-antitoxin module
MTQIKEKFLVDDQGQRVAVLLDISDYENLLDELDELDAIKAYDAAKASGEDSIPLEDALAEVDRNRKK